MTVLPQRSYEPINSFTGDSRRLGLVKPKGRHRQKAERGTTRNGDTDNDP